MASSLSFDWLRLAAPVIGSPLAGFVTAETRVYYSRLLEFLHSAVSVVAEK